jgi:hypothetical protein
MERLMSLTAFCAAAERVISNTKERCNERTLANRQTWQPAAEAEVSEVRALRGAAVREGHRVMPVTELGRLLDAVVAACNGLARHIHSRHCWQGGPHLIPNDILVHDEQVLRRMVGAAVAAIQPLRDAAIALDGIAGHQQRDGSPNAPAAQSEPETAEAPEPGAAKARRGSVNQRMLETIHRDPSSVEWTQRKWAEYLGCQPSAVAQAPAWQTIKTARALAAVDRMDRPRK